MYINKERGLTHGELTGQLALVVPGVQRYVLFRPQDQQAVLGEARTWKKKDSETEKNKRNLLHKDLILGSF